MPGFIGGSSASSGTGGEISFPKEFTDPVTKLRVSQPETLIDTDFEYGLQPTKWETVELINNTPSFFSKGGDTTIPNISALVTNAGTREITVTTTIEHGLSVGIPISVTGTKSVTADGTYIINSIPNTTSFTYLCKENQATTASIEDLYTSIITGEFFQGSQIRIASAGGMITNAAPTSTITVNTPSPHGFKVNTPFYFLNLNSTVSQVFDSSNSTTKSFDASNSSTAQTFDGSNTLNSTNIDFSNSAVVGGVTSAISGVSQVNDTISVNHSTENFFGKPIGTPLYYNVTTSSNYFADNPRGIVFLKTNNTLGTLTSTFQVSALPDDTAIDITATMTGTFQLANQARTYAGNNIDLATEQTLSVVNDTAKTFNGSNTGGLFATCTSFPGTATINGVSGSGIADLAWYEGAMVFYTTSGTAASGLTNNTTYFVTNFTQQGTSTTYSFNLKPLPTGAIITVISGGTGTHTFTQIGVSIDKDVFHIRNNGYVVNDMLRYDYPANGKFGVVSIDQNKDFYFVSQTYDSHNFTLNQVIGEIVPATDSRTGTNAGTAISPTSPTAVGFGAGLTYAVTNGTLPAGLSLNTSTGVISGTPTAAYSTAVVTITASDSAGTTGTQAITFQFNPAPNLYSFTSATFASSRGLVSVNNSSPVSAPPKSEIAQYLTNTGQTANRTQMDNSTYVDVPANDGYIWWMVPESANYRITVAGAGGGGGFGPGAAGARLAGTIPLTQGEVLWLTAGIAGAYGNTNYGDLGSGGGGGLSAVAKSSSTSKTFQSGTMTLLMMSAGGEGSPEARIGRNGTPGNPANGGGGTGYSSNWLTKDMNGRGGGYGGQTNYGGWGGGQASDDSAGQAGGYDGLWVYNPNSYANTTLLSNISRDNYAAYTNGYIEIVKQ